MIEEALQAHLVADVGLTTLIGTRCHSLQLPQRSPLPAITYQRISTLPLHHRSSMVANFGRTRFQFDVWSATYLQALTVRAALYEAMGTLPQASNPRIDVALLQDARDAFEAEPERWRAIVDYYIWHTES